MASITGDSSPSAPMQAIIFSHHSIHLFTLLKPLCHSLFGQLGRMKLLVLLIAYSLCLQSARCVIVSSVTHITAVGCYENKFTPASLNAKVGDYVKFHFHENPTYESYLSYPSSPVAITSGIRLKNSNEPERGEQGPGGPSRLSSCFLDRQGDYNLNSPPKQDQDREIN